MDHDSSSPSASMTDRAARIRKILDECVSVRGRGQALPDAEILAAHPDLAADLAPELRKLALIQKARQQADETVPAAARRGADDSAAPRLSDAPFTFPGYEIRGEIHRGGQGVVYEAVQQSTKRTVALKVMKEGPFSGDADKIRFEREVQVLAGLQHPHIVAIHDSGLAAGHFYYAMDYIRGQTLDRWNLDFGLGILDLKSGGAGAQSKIQDQKSKIETSLRLFLEICDAIQAAHLRGVIHRDLKPGNILVDEQGRPHILDFGLAKLTTPDDSGAVLTHTRDFLGTPAYASPEQARGANHEVDVRSDVYALGVILYELLTGRLPYPPHLNFLDLLQAIQHAEPPRPSAFRPGLDRDLDLIVHKALRKEQAERYQSVDALAADLKRHLAGEAVLAHPPSVAYQLRKLVRRHKAAVLGAAAFALLLVAAAVVSMSLYWRAEGERRRANGERDAAVAARAAEEAQRRRAESEQTRAETNERHAVSKAAQQEAVNKFLQDMLASANRGEQKGNADVTVREVLDIAARELEAGGRRYEPEVEAAVRDTIGRTYRALARYDAARVMHEKAADLWRRARGESNADVAGSLNYLALVRLEQGHLQEAETLCRAALEMRRQTQGATHPEVAETLMNLASVLEDQGRFSEAEENAQAALEMLRAALGTEHLHVAVGLERLALIFGRQNRLDEAESLQRAALAMRRKLLGEEHVDVAVALCNLTTFLQRQGRFEEAEALCREALALYRKLFGNTHPDVAACQTNLASIVRERGRPDEAEALLREALALYRRLLGQEHPDIATALNNLGLLLQKQGRPDEAEPLLREGLAMRRKLLGDEHPYVASSLNNLALALRDLGRLAEAETAYRAALALNRKLLGDAHPDLASALVNLAVLLQQQRRFDEAEPLLREGLAMRRKTLGDEHPSVAADLHHLGALLRECGRLDEAEPLFHEALALRRKLPGADPLDAASTLSQLAALRVDQNRPAEAETLSRELLAIFEGRLPPGHWRAANARIGLGRALAKLGRYREAEDALTQGYAGVRGKRGAAQAAERAALQQFIQLYEAWHAAEPGQGHDQQAAEWRAKFQAATQPAAPSGAAGS